MLSQHPSGAGGGGGGAGGGGRDKRLVAYVVLLQDAASTVEELKSQAEAAGAGVHGAGSVCAPGQAAVNGQRQAGPSALPAPELSRRTDRGELCGAEAAGAAATGADLGRAVGGATHWDQGRLFRARRRLVIGGAAL